jgi:uncharacterized integral membrane protein
MKTTLHLMTTTIVALVALFCAVLAYQNAVPVQLQFFGARSIEMPLGFILVSAIALGLVTLPLILAVPLRKKAPRRTP